MPRPGGYFRPAPKKRRAVTPPRPEVAVGPPPRRSVRGPQRTQSVNPAVNPRAAGPIAPKQRVHVRRNTAITQPLNTPAFARQQRQAARHVARAVIGVATQGKSTGPKRPLYDHEVRAVLTSPQGRQIIASAERATRAPQHKAQRNVLRSAVGFVKSGGGLQYSLGLIPTAAGINPFKIQKTAAIAGVNTARAAIESPEQVLPKTVAGAGQLAIGAIAAIPEVAIQTGTGAAHGDPLRGVKQLASQAAKDYSRRYGAIYRGEPGAAKAFRERIKQEGAASELVDAATIAVPEGAIAGRAAGSLARAGKLGPRLERVATEPRPALRISGTETRPQELSPNLFRAALQRKEDAIRQQRLAKRNAQAQAKGRPLPGLQPRQRAVVRPGRQVDIAARQEQVFDPRATRKALARHERRRVDRPFIQKHEVPEFKRGAKYTALMWHVTTPEAAKVVAKHGLDPAKAQRGTYGLGVYSASVPENIPGATASVQVAVRMRNPLILSADKAMTALKPFRDAAVKKVGKEDLRLLSAEMTRGLQRAGYDGVVVKGAMRGGDYVVNFHPQDVRVVANRTTARRGGRTSAVLERNLPSETATRVARKVNLGEVSAPAAPEVVAATKAGQRRLQRVAVSTLASRVFHGFKNEQMHEIDRGAKRDVAHLNKHQQAAAVTAIQGLVTAHDPAKAIEQLKRRNAQIIARREAETAERAKRGLGPRPIPTALHGDELALNNYLIEHANEIFNFKFGEFQKAQAERSIRAAAEGTDAHPVFRSSTAEVRRLRAQGDFLEVPYEYEIARHAIEDTYAEARRAADTEAGAALAKQEHDAALKALEDRKPEIDAKYVTEVRKRAAAEGLPEPGFVGHHPRPDYGFSDFAPGGAKAITGVRRTELTLHRLGIADTHPSRYFQSLARTIKYKYNWPGVAAQADAHSFSLREFGTEQELRDILGRKRVTENGMTIEDWRRVLHAKGLNPGDYAFWNPGRLRVAKQEFDSEGHVGEHLDVGDGPEGAPGVSEGWQSAAIDTRELEKLPQAQRDVYVQTRGWKLLPREAYSEITDGTKPSGVFGRSAGKVQAFQSRILLGLNPTWLQVQVAANTFLGGFGVGLKRGRPTDFIEAQRWYARQPEDVRRTIDDALSVGVYQGHGEKVHYGAAANNDIVNWVRALGELPAFQKAKKVNPIELIFKGDHAQNAFFRKAVLYSSLKRDAFRDMGRGIGKTFEQQKEIAKVLAIKDPEARLQAIVRNPQLFERHAQYVNDILGDYSRFTARERRYLKRGVLFYGFMRYSLRTLFYTLPVKHPVAAAVTAKLAQLHNDEVRDLLGGPDAPWAYSRVFFEGKDGKLRSIDFGRANPVTNPIINVSSEGKQALGGFISPVVQTITDQLYGKSLYSGQAFHVKGSAEDNPNPDAVTSARIVANDLLSTAFPYREAVKLTQGGTKQGDDTLLFSPRPIHYKTAQAQGRADQRAQAQGSGTQQVLRDLAPLFVPKPDTSRDVVAGRRRKRGGGGGNRWGTSTSGSSSPSSGNRWGTGG